MNFVSLCKQTERHYLKPHNVKYYDNYNNLLTVEPYNTQGTRVTKVTKKPYGYRIQLFNHYVTLYYVKLIINTDGTAKAHWRVEKNYSSIQRFTVYHNSEGKEITRSEYYKK